MAARHLPGAFPFRGALVALLPGGVALLIGVPVTASAFQQARTANSCGTRWYGANAASGVVDVAYTLGDKPPDGITAFAFAAAVDLAFDAWAAVHCSVCANPSTGCAPIACKAQPLGVTFTALGPATPGPFATRCPEPAPGCGSFVQAVQGPEKWPFGKAVIAQTTVVRNTLDGTIVDADILINDVDLNFCLVTCAAGKHDLQSTLTHEIGHFLGMDHSEVAEARMAPYVGQGPADPLALHDDDRLGVCTAYRTKCAPMCSGAGCCMPDGSVKAPKPGDGAGNGGGCCAVTPRRGAQGPWGIGMALAAVAVLARWRRARFKAPAS